MAEICRAKMRAHRASGEALVLPVAHAAIQCDKEAGKMRLCEIFESWTQWLQRLLRPYVHAVTEQMEEVRGATRGLDEVCTRLGLLVRQGEASFVGDDLWMVSRHAKPPERLPIRRSLRHI
eukprot:GHVU01180430.1.p2 GENE.GHVU01180430.1~~GHVU01180430.1.p2  ORF type:complete len:121 (+),score=4.96 GHVU01180430.1:434-796(+)